MAVDEGAVALEADAAAVFLHDEHGSRFVTLAHTGYPQELATEHTSFPTSVDNP